MRFGNKIENIKQNKITNKKEKENESKNDLILKENINKPIENNLLNSKRLSISQKKIALKKDFNELKNEDKISNKNYRDQSKLSLNNENALKIISDKLLSNINSKRKSLVIDESLKRAESPTGKSRINRVRRINHIFSFYYFFFDFIFDKLVNPQNFAFFSK